MDWFLLLAEARLKTEVALQHADVICGAAKAIPTQAGKLFESANGTTASSPVTPGPSAAKLRRDANATNSTQRPDRGSKRDISGGFLASIQRGISLCLTSAQRRKPT